MEILGDSESCPELVGKENSLQYYLLILADELRGIVIVNAIRELTHVDKLKLF
jgi:hypothetical protein